MLDGPKRAILAEEGRGAIALAVALLPMDSGLVEAVVDLTVFMLAGLAHGAAPGVVARRWCAGRGSSRG